MATTHYEVQIVCNNCGCLVSRATVDESTLTRYAAAAEAEAFSPLGSSFEEPPLTSEGLTSEEAEFPVEVAVQHVPVCRRFAQRL